MGKRRSTAPDRGDVVWLDFRPRVGREQGRRRPAMVLSPKSYNSKVGLVVVCPITTQSKGYPFEVGLEGTTDTTGVVLADQIKSLDWRARHAETKDHVSDHVVEDVRAKIMVLIGPDE